MKIRQTGKEMDFNLKRKHKIWQRLIKAANLNLTCIVEKFKDTPT